VKCSLYKPVWEALEKAGFGGRILNKEALPFPSHGHQKTYRQKLRRMIAEERTRNSALKQKDKSCLVACSVLRKEIAKLIRHGDLDAECVYVSKYFHVDYAQIEKNLRPVLERAIERFPGRVVLVYGDLCLGMDNEMKKLADEYGIAKIDALNCIDCQLGGKGKSVEVDPHQDLMFLTPGMTDFFKHAKDAIIKEGIDEIAFKQLFRGIRGIVLLDTLGNATQLKDEVEKLDTGLKILETRQVGCENVKEVIQEAIEKTETRKGTGNEC
jgi:hypothetical protein